MIGTGNQQSYYGSTDLGQYQFIKLINIIDNFMYVHVGENKIISKVNKIDVQFHAIRAIQ